MVIFTYRIRDPSWDSGMILSSKKRRQVCVFIGWALAQSSGGAKDLQKCFDVPRVLGQVEWAIFLAVINNGKWMKIGERAVYIENPSFLGIYVKVLFLIILPPQSWFSEKRVYF